MAGDLGPIFLSAGRRGEGTADSGLTPDHSVKAAGGEVLGFWPACGDHQAHRRAPTGFLLQPLFL